MVLFIFVDLTMPDKIRPRMEMLPVKGHFLSMYVPANSAADAVPEAKLLNVLSLNMSTALAHQLSVARPKCASSVQQCAVGCCW